MLVHFNPNSPVTLFFLLYCCYTVRRTVAVLFQEQISMEVMQDLLNALENGESPVVAPEVSRTNLAFTSPDINLANLLFAALLVLAL